MDCIVHGVTKSLTQLSNFHFQSHFVHWQKIHGCKCIPHSHSIEAQSVLESADPPVLGGMPQSIYVLWLRWFSTRCFCQVWEVEAGGCCKLVSSKLCRIPYPKYMTDPSREMRWWEGKVGALPTYKWPIELLLWCLTQFRGEVVGWGFFFSIIQVVLFFKEASYQWLSRYQIGSRS